MKRKILGLACETMMATPGYQQGGYPPSQGGYQQQQAPPQGGYQQQQAPPQGGYQQQAPPQGGYQQQQQPPGYQPAPSNLQPPQGDSAPPPAGEEDVGKDRPASPPPLSDMDRVQGYEDVNFQADAFIPPPAYEPAAPDHAHSPPVQADIPTISEENARDALMREVNNHCCYGKKAAENLVFTNMMPSSAFHYQLETFTEGRRTAWAFDPYSGQPVDGPENGPAPGPWDISAPPGNMFVNHSKVFEVPHTASVKVCHGCLGVGMNQCKRCLGCGQVTCTACSGSGRQLQPHIHHDHHHHHGHHDHHHGHHHHHGGTHVDVESVRCMSCHGSGRKMCWICHGSGRTKCSVCETKGQLKCYIKLTVSWKNNKADHVVERTALPDHLIRGAQGRVVLQDTQPKLFPVTGFPDAAVNDASRQLVESHAVSFPTERILSQRHWVRIIPVSEARCDYNGKPFTFWVYGDDKNVHAPDYPQQVCWGCTIL